MKRHMKLTSEEQQHPAAGQKTQSQSAHEFATVEEMLRHDSAHTIVPPEIASRLQKSTGDLPPPNRSWWKRIFGGTHP